MGVFNDLNTRVVDTRRKRTFLHSSVRIMSVSH